MKVAIVGSRDFAMRPGSSTHNKEVFIQQVVGRLSHEDYVVSGGANGADFWAEYFARHYSVGRIIHEADWKKYGRSAGPIRNALIVKDADCMFAFFTDRSNSRGTRNSVTQARKKGIPVYEYDAATEEIPWWIGTEWEKNILV